LKVFDYAKEQLNFWFEEQFKKGMQKYGVPLLSFDKDMNFRVVGHYSTRWKR